MTSVGSSSASFQQKAIVTPSSATYQSVLRKPGMEPPCPKTSWAGDFEFGDAQPVTEATAATQTQSLAEVGHRAEQISRDHAAAEERIAECRHRLRRSGQSTCGPGGGCRW